MPQHRYSNVEPGVRRHFSARVREAVEEFLERSSLADLMLLSDILFTGGFSPNEDELAERMRNRLGLGYQGPDGPHIEDVAAEIPEAQYYEIDAVGTREDGGDEECSHTIVTSITREELEELIHFLASMRWIARGAKPDLEGAKRQREAVNAQYAPAEQPEEDAAHA
jgi:hypothetical protein